MVPETSWMAHNMRFCKRLTAEEERDAAERQDYQALIEAVLPYAVKVARGFHYGDSVLHEELVSDAYLAVCEAVRDFDPAKVGLQRSSPTRFDGSFFGS